MFRFTRSWSSNRQDAEHSGHICRGSKHIFPESRFGIMCIGFAWHGEITGRSVRESGRTISHQHRTEGWSLWCVLYTSLKGVESEALLAERPLVGSKGTWVPLASRWRTRWKCPQSPRGTSPECQAGHWGIRASRKETIPLGIAGHWHVQSCFMDAYKHKSRAGRIKLFIPRVCASDEASDENYWDEAYWMQHHVMRSCIQDSYWSGSSHGVLISVCGWRWPFLPSNIPGFQVL